VCKPSSRTASTSQVTRLPSATPSPTRYEDRMLSGRKAAEAILKGAPSSYQRWWTAPLLLC
jgi:hypothetical protein